jgi:hypothetical protein
MPQCREWAPFAEKRAEMRQVFRLGNDEHLA